MHDYGCLLAVIPDPLRKQITDWAIENIIDEHIASGGRETRPHVTIKYGFTGGKEIGDSLVEAFDDVEPFELSVGKFSTFSEGDDGVPLFLEVDSELLHEWNAVVSEHFDTVDTHPNYKPHITVAYLKPEFVDLYLKMDNPMNGTTVTVRHLEYSDAQGNTTQIELGNAPQQDLEFTRLLESEKKFLGEIHTKSLKEQILEHLLSDAVANQSSWGRGPRFASVFALQWIPFKYWKDYIQYDEETGEPYFFDSAGFTSSDKTPNNIVREFMYRRRKKMRELEDIQAEEAYDRFGEDEQTRVADRLHNRVMSIRDEYRTILPMKGDVIPIGDKDWKIDKRGEGVIDKIFSLLSKSPDLMPPDLHRVQAGSMGDTLNFVEWIQSEGRSRELDVDDLIDFVESNLGMSIEDYYRQQTGKEFTPEHWDYLRNLTNDYVKTIKKVPISDDELATLGVPKRDPEDYFEDRWIEDLGPGEIYEMGNERQILEHASSPDEVNSIAHDALDTGMSAEEYLEDSALPLDPNLIKLVTDEMNRLRKQTSKTDEPKGDQGSFFSWCDRDDEGHCMPEKGLNMGEIHTKSLRDQVLDQISNYSYDTGAALAQIPFKYWKNSVEEREIGDITRYNFNEVHFFNSPHVSNDIKRRFRMFASRARSKQADRKLVAEIRQLVDEDVWDESLEREYIAKTIQQRYTGYSNEFLYANALFEGDVLPGTDITVGSDIESNALIRLQFELLLSIAKPYALSTTNEEKVRQFIEQLSDDTPKDYFDQEVIDGAESNLGMSIEDYYRQQTGKEFTPEHWDYLRNLTNDYVKTIKKVPISDDELATLGVPKRDPEDYFEDRWIEDLGPGEIYEMGNERQILEYASHPDEVNSIAHDALDTGMSAEEYLEDRALPLDPNLIKLVTEAMGKLRKQTSKTDEPKGDQGSFFSWCDRDDEGHCMPEKGLNMGEIHTKNFLSDLVSEWSTTRDNGDHDNINVYYTDAMRAIPEKYWRPFVEFTESYSKGKNHSFNLGMFLANPNIPPEVKREFTTITAETTARINDDVMDRYFSTNPYGINRPPVDKVIHAISNRLEHIKAVSDAASNLYEGDRVDFSEHPLSKDEADAINFIQGQMKYPIFDIEDAFEEPEIAANYVVDISDVGNLPSVDELINDVESNLGMSIEDYYRQQTGKEFTPEHWKWLKNAISADMYAIVNVPISDDELATLGVPKRDPEDYFEDRWIEDLGPGEIYEMGNERQILEHASSPDEVNSIAHDALDTGMSAEEYLEDRALPLDPNLIKLVTEAMGKLRKQTSKTDEPKGDQGSFFSWCDRDDEGHCMPEKALSAYNETTGGALLNMDYDREGRGWRRPIRFLRAKGSSLPVRNKSIVPPRIKAGFTGRYIDSSGRNVCFSDGRRVACSADIPEGAPPEERGRRGGIGDIVSGNRPMNANQLHSFTRKIPRGYRKLAAAVAIISGASLLTLRSVMAADRFRRAATKVVKLVQSKKGNPAELLAQKEALKAILGEYEDAKYNEQLGAEAFRDLGPKQRDQVLATIDNAPEDQVPAIWNVLKHPGLPHLEPQNAAQLRAASEELWHHSDWMKAAKKPGESDFDFIKRHLPSLENLSNLEVMDIGDSHVRQNLYELSLLSPNLLNKMSGVTTKQLTRIVMGAGSVEKLLGKQATGRLLTDPVQNWPAGQTWEQTSVLYTGQDVIIGTKGVDLSASSPIHAAAHALLVKTPGYGQALTAFHKQLVKDGKLEPYAQKSKSDMFAESVAYLYMKGEKATVEKYNQDYVDWLHKFLEVV